MHFGAFAEFTFRDGAGAAQAFEQGFALARHCEDLGLHSVWLSEFHFMPDRSVLSSPVVTAAAIAAATRRIRIGLAVYVLPLANPLRTAEEIATLDQISGGRLDFGIGRSGFARAYDAYCVDYAQSQARFDEALEILKLAFAGERFSYDGRYYRVNDALLVPRPLQRPGPPMRMAASSTPTFDKVARTGLPLFVGLRGDGLEALAQNIRTYRRVWDEVGHEAPSSVFLRVPVFAATSQREALEQPRESIVHYFSRQARLSAGQGARSGQGDDNRARISAQLAALSYQDILDSRVCFGSPDAMVERLRHWQSELGIDGVVMETNAGGMLSEAQELESIRLIATEVMPALQ
ncbi:MAG: LLM class flavin-dependent oxidoreductase [Gammaproteobacteria bacterium]|nr:LLM class flavin-dependent oxidoreductase [Gammaproteobacteria bacterium]